VARRIAIRGGEGQLACRLRGDRGAEREVVLDGYVEAGYSGDVTLRILRDGSDVVEAGYR
jgi:hypothetical protein